MASSEFDDLIAQARQIGSTLGNLFEELTGEELDLESTIKHYPVVAVGLGIGIGAIAGWWVGSKRMAALPPPVQEPPPVADTRSGSGWLGDLFSRGQESGDRESGTSTHPLDRLETMFPGGAEKVRDVLPDIVSEEAAAMAKSWVDTVLEPKLRQGIDSMAANVSESKLGTFFKQRLAALDDTEDHKLDDPEPPPNV